MLSMHSPPSPAPNPAPNFPAPMNLLSKLARWLYRLTPEARASRLRRSEAGKRAWAKRHDKILRPTVVIRSHYPAMIELFLGALGQPGEVRIDLRPDMSWAMQVQVLFKDGERGSLFIDELDTELAGDPQKIAKKLVEMKADPKLRMAQYEHQPDDAILTKENKP